MHEQTAVSESSNGGPVAVGFLIGAALGAGVALLLAPASGSRTRRRLGRVAENLRSGLDHGLDEVRHRFEDARSDASSAFNAGREAFGKARDARHRDDDTSPHSATS